MNKTQLLKKLKSLDQEDLISLLSSLVDSSPAFSTILSNAFMSPEQVAEQRVRNLKKYISKLEKLFDTTPPNSPAFPSFPSFPAFGKVEKLLAEFLSSLPAPSEADIALFKLKYAEGCINELDAWGNGPEELEDLAFENYKAALDYAKKDEAFFFDNLQLLYDVANTYPGADYFREYLQELVYPKMWDASLLLARIDAAVNCYCKPIDSTIGNNEANNHRAGNDEEGDGNNEITLEKYVRLLLYSTKLLYSFQTPESPRGSAARDTHRNTKNVIRQVIAKLKGLPADKTTQQFPSVLIKTLAQVYAIDARKIEPMQCMHDREIMQIS